MSIQRILQLRSAISISSRFFSTHVGGKPGGIIAAEPVKGAAFKIPEPIDDKCGPLGIDDEEEEDMVPMIDPDTGMGSPFPTFFLSILMFLF